VDDAVLRGAKRFAANLRRLRESKGLSQEEVAERAGIAPRTLRGLENVHYTPSFKTAVKLADALQVDIVELFKPAKFVRRLAGRPRRC
jgi:transcriptional regulator with XRE-family HTH domain